MTRTQRWTTSSGLRVGLLALILVAVSLGLVILNLRTTAALAGDSAWMSTAGSCRKNTYRLLFLAHRLFDLNGRPSDFVRGDLNTVTREMDALLATLRDGDEARGLSAPTDAKTLTDVHELADEWTRTVRPLVVAIAGAEVSVHPSQELELLDLQAEVYASRIARVVGTYEASSARRVARLRSVERLSAATAAGVFLLLTWIVWDAIRRIRSLALTVSPLAREAGDPRGVDSLGTLGAALDHLTSKRREAEEALRRSEARFTSYMKHLPGVAFLKDLAGNLIWVNEAFERALGLERPAWLGRFEHDLWPSHTRHALRAYDRLVVERKAPVQDLETVDSEGTPRHWFVSRFPILDAEGTPLYIGGVAIDVTDREHAEEELRETQARYAAIVKTAVDGIVTIDEEGRIDSVNPAALRIFGYTAEEVLGKNVKLLMPSPYREEHSTYLGNYLRTGKARIIGIGREVVGLRKDGTLFPLELAVSEIRLGERRLFTGFVRDVTERRRAESLAEAGLLASGIAHEIGTPMNVILGRAEFIREQLKDPQLGRGLDVIIAQVERIARLMNQLLALTRPHPIVPGPVDLNRLVADTLEVLVDRLKSSRVQLRREFAADLPSLQADKDTLGQLVLNLLVNAIDAMAMGGTLSVRTAALSVERGEGAAAEQVELSIGDSGAGIPAENLSKIFHPFFTTKGPGRGTGLGLSLVQGIVHQHRGEILVESEVGRGTTFRVRLPLRAPAPPRIEA